MAKAVFSSIIASHVSGGGHIVVNVVHHSAITGAEFNKSLFLSVSDALTLSDDLADLARDAGVA